MPPVLPERLLLGSGPSPVPQRVLDALAQPTIGHLDPAFGEVMEELAAALRATFRTENAATLPVSGTGSAGMEATVVNFVEPGDRVVCGVNGLFGERMADELARNGAEVVRVEAPWGRALDTGELIGALDGAAALFVVHGETSTGVCQPLDGLGEACRSRDALLFVDCVTSLGGQRLEVDDAGIDVAFSGTQKCLNCPPGLAPFTAGERAVAKLRGRTAKVRSWYLDLSLVLDYWQPGSSGRVYHHTAPINMVYALREAVAMVQEEGMEARWDRHAVAHERLRMALEVLGCERLAPDGEQLHPLLAVTPPEGTDLDGIRTRLATEHGIEIAAGAGQLAGRAWRIGVMGEGARIEPQERLVRALAAELGGDVSEALAALAAPGLAGELAP